MSSFSLSPAITNELMSTTMLAMHKEIVETKFIPLPFLDAIEKNKAKEEGGERLTVAWSFREHSDTTQLATGYEPVNLTVRPLGETGQEQWGDWVRPIVISGHEERINRGSNKIVSILEERLTNTELGMRAEFQQQLLQGNVAAMSDCVTLEGGTYSTGLIEPVVTSSQNNTIHGVARGGYSLTDGFTNQFYDGAASFSANGLVGLYDITSRIARITGKEVGKFGKDIQGYISLAASNNLKKVLNSNERYLSADKLDAGRPVLTYAGIPLNVVDLPTSGAKPWSVLFLDHSAIQWVEQTGFWFKLGQFQTQPGYDVRAAFLQHMGQLKGKYFGTSGVLYDADTYV